MIRRGYEPAPAVRELVFEQVTQRRGKPLLLQRVNPGFDRRIRVYALPHARSRADENPDAIESSLLYRAIREGGEPLRLTKSSYRRAFDRLLGDCPAVLERYPRGERKFRHFADHVYAFEELCPEG